MKIIAFGDLHAHLFEEFSEVDSITGNSRFTQILNTLSFMREYCVKNGITHVLDAGDIFHKRMAVNTLVFNKVFNEIKKFSDLGIKVIMIPGNHTQLDNSDFPEHSIEPFKEIPNVTVLDRFEPYYLGIDYDTFIYPAPYSKNARMVKEAINRYAEQAKSNPEDCNILLGHLGVSGAYVGKGSYAMADAFSYEDLRPDAFDFGVLGHFHKRQTLGGNPNFFYTGAPIQHSFGDEGEEKGFMLLDTETKTAEFVPIPSPMFVTIKVHQITEGLIDLLEDDMKNNFIRFQVSAEAVEQLAEHLPEEAKYRMEVQKEFKEERRVDVDFSMSFSEIITEYAKKFNPEALETGLSILREVEEGK